MGVWGKAFDKFKKINFANIFKYFFLSFIVRIVVMILASVLALLPGGTFAAFGTERVVHIILTIIMTIKFKSAYLKNEPWYIFFPIATYLEFMGINYVLLMPLFEGTLI